jgi:prepilin-type N-terminal cleavage/methylation domain-containing protein
MTTRRPHRTSRCHTRGFTLLEVLLALFIFSTAVISLVEAINATGRTVLLSRRERQVQARLETILLEATRSPEALSKMRPSTKQESTVTEGDVSYVIRCSPVEMRNKDDRAVPDMFSVSVTALWKEGREEQVVSAETWVYPRLFLQPTQQPQP